LKNSKNKIKKKTREEKHPEVDANIQLGKEKKERIKGMFSASIDKHF